jgi:hypothetical protein
LPYSKTKGVKAELSNNTAMLLLWIIDLLDDALVVAGVVLVNMTQTGC